MKQRYAKLYLAMLSVGMSILPLQAMADDTPVDDDKTDAVVDLGLIVIKGVRPSAWQSPDGVVATRSASATKTDTQLRFTPASVSVVTKDQMQDQGSESVAQALRYSAGTYTESRISPRFDSLFIRGFGGFGQNANFVHHLDGQKLPRGLSYLVPNIDPYLIERIDVVRGANSAIHGQINPGGMVNQISKRAYFTPEREVVLKAGTQDMRMLGVDVNHPVNEQLALRLTGLYRESQSETDVDAERYAVMPSLTWQPNERTQLTVQALSQKDPSGGDYNATPIYGTLINNPAGNISRDTFFGDLVFETYDRTMNSVGYQLSHRINDSVSLQHQSRYTDAKSIFRNTSPNGYVADTTYKRIATASDEKMDGINSDMQVRFRLGTDKLMHTFNVGMDYQRSHAERLFGSGVAPDIDTNNARTNDGKTLTPAFATDSTRKQTQYGIYLQDQIQAGNWLAQLGIRHDKVRTYDTIAAATTGALQRQSSKWDNKTTYQASLLYGADNGLSPYISYATSFEPTTALNQFGNPFEPTTAEQWEVGLKYQPADYKALFTLSAFNLTRDNVLTKDVRTEAHPSAQIQTGRVQVQGVELEARAEWTPRFSTIFTATYLKPEVRKSNISQELGKAPVGVPTTMAALWGQYALLDDDLKLSAGVRHVGGSYSDIGNTFKIPSNTLIDMGVNYHLGALNPRLKGLHANLTAHNITDERHYASCFSRGVTMTPAATNCFSGARRSIVAGLSYKW